MKTLLDPYVCQKVEQNSGISLTISTETNSH
jgi:hypothetical protein